MPGKRAHGLQRKSYAGNDGDLATGQQSMFARAVSSPRRRSHDHRHLVGGRAIFAVIFLLVLSGALNIYLLGERLSWAHEHTRIIQQQELRVSTTVTQKTCPSVNCSSVCSRLKCGKAASKQKTIGSLDAVSGVVSSAGSNRATANQISSPSESVTLFIGILSGRGYRHRRQAVRDAWASKCQVQGVSACRFILAEQEVTPMVEEEMQQYQDIVLVHGDTTYKSILLKSLFVLEHAVTHYDARCAACAHAMLALRMPEALCLPPTGTIVCALALHDQQM